MPGPDDQIPQMPRASRRLAHHPRRTAREMLADVTDYTGSDVEQDEYGAGAVVEDLETRVADLLGKEAAVAMPSGTMAQQIALRIWCDRAGLHHVAFHPTCHLEQHEENAYQRLHGITATLLGAPDRLFTLADLESMHEPVAAVLFELPQREIGGVLPDWDELVAMTAWAQQAGIATHMDGARLWETQPHYGRTYAEIAALFDTVYVSFYKILGGVAGAALAGPEDVIDLARVWMRRHGGNLVHMYPFALSAQLGLDRHLERMGEYHARAVEIGAILSALAGVTIRPDPPHTNMMHVYVEGDVERLNAAHREIVADHDIELFWKMGETGVPNVGRFELTVGSAAEELSLDTIRELFTDLLHRARD